MSNPLPAGAIPKLYRLRNKDGKEIGAWYCKIKKVPVNLRTQDYFKARERAALAVNEGKRDFTDERYFDDGASTPKTETPETPRPSESTAPQAAPSVDWTADAVRAASASITPDAIFPPSRQLPPMERPTEHNAPSDAPKPKPETPDAADESTTLPPEMLENLVKQIAATIVELQINGQEYLAIRWGKFQPGQVPPDSKARELPTAIWEAQVKKWIPSDVPLPAWIVAPVLTAMLTIPIQLEGATPLKKSDVPTS